MYFLKPQNRWQFKKTNSDVSKQMTSYHDSKKNIFLTLKHGYHFESLELYSRGEDIGGHIITSTLKPLSESFREIEFFETLDIIISRKQLPKLGYHLHPKLTFELNHLH